MLTFGEISEPYATGGGDPEVYKDYPKGYMAAQNKMLAQVSMLPEFKILSVEDIDLGKFYWRLAKLSYTYEKEATNG